MFPCLNVNYSNSYLRMVSAGRPVTIPFSNEDEILERFGSIFIFFNLRVVNMDVDLDLS